MHVKSFKRVLRSPRLNLFPALVISLCAIFLLAAFVTDRTEIISKRINLAVRAIGHELLLQSRDSTSLVRPVIEKSHGVFLLEFENEFSFQPDTLVAIVQRLLAKTKLSQYTVTVQQCDRPRYIVYGFEISPPDNINISCRGRNQPKACYNIEIAFADYPDSDVRYTPATIVISGILLMLAVALIGRNLRPEKTKPPVEQITSIENDTNSVLTIGRYAFNTTNQCLKIGEETIPLTDKECRILTLLNRNIGRLTLRDELIQEVWTDDGVITGRSLDMFISKLRKKLNGDPDLRITNVHGKGYRLEIVNDSV
jgi:hypothetical protein